MLSPIIQNCILEVTNLRSLGKHNFWKITLHVPSHTVKQWTYFNTDQCRHFHCVNDESNVWIKLYWNPKVCPIYKLHWNLLQMVYLTNSHDWFWWWLCDEQVTSHWYLNQWWPQSWSPYGLRRPQWMKSDHCWYKSVGLSLDPDQFFKHEVPN